MSQEKREIPAQVTEDALAQGLDVNRLSYVRLLMEKGKFTDDCPPTPKNSPEEPEQTVVTVKTEVIEGVPPNIVELVKALGLSTNRLTYVRWLIENEKICDNFKPVMEQMPLPGFQQCS